MYWSIDIPGLTEPGAAQVVSLCEQAGVGEVGCFAVNPMSALTIHLDLTSVEAIVGALEDLKNNAVVAGLRETMVDRLRWQEATGRPGDQPDA
jgi:hypothetical protein